MINTQGYVYVLKHDHPFADKRNKRVLVHRLLYEHYLKIMFDEDVYIPSNIDIHHDNGNRQDNSLINLQAMDHKDHMKLEYTGKFTTYIDKSQRYCLLCGGKATKSKQGWERWRCHKNGFICEKCFMRNKKSELKE